jgi:hypothetical protein
MAMGIIPLSALIGLILVWVTGFFPSKRALIHKYGQMERRDLIHAYVSSKNIVKLGLGLAFIIIPILMGFLIPMIKDRFVREAFIALFIFGSFSAISMCGSFWRIWTITEGELKMRDSSKKL